MIQPQKQWIDYLNSTYVENYGQEFLVFKLDKTRTQLDPVYNEESYARIYLPPFKIKGIYNVPNYTYNIDNSGVNINDQSQLAISINLNDMVNAHLKAKNSYETIFKLEYTGNKSIFLSKSDSSFTVYINENNNVLPLSEYSTLSKLREYFLTIPNFTCQIEGSNNFTNKINNFDRLNLNSSIFRSEFKSHVYENISDVIESGDVILSHFNFFYEVKQANPAGNVGWNYASFNIVAARVQPSLINIPDQFIKKANRNEFGLKGSAYFGG